MAGDALDALYQETILDHYQHPRNHARLLDPTVATEGHNPLCGDQLALQLKLAGGHIAKVGLQGKGCAISQASASMMSEAIQDQTPEEAERLAGAFRQFMTSEERPDEDLGTLAVLEGVRQFPTRIKCATLGWMTLQEALKEYRAGQREGKLVVKE